MSLSLDYNDLPKFRFCDMDVKAREKPLVGDLLIKSYLFLVLVVMTAIYAHVWVKRIRLGLEVEGMYSATFIFGVCATILLIAACSGWKETAKSIANKRESRTANYKNNREKEYKKLFAKIDSVVDAEENSLYIFDDYIVVRQNQSKKVIFFVDLLQVILQKSKYYFTIKFERYRSEDNVKFNLEIPIEELSILKRCLNCKVDVVKEKRYKHNKEKITAKKIVRNLAIPVPIMAVGIALTIVQSCGVAVPSFLGYFFIGVGALVLICQFLNTDFVVAVLILIIFGLLFMILPIMVVKAISPNINMSNFLDMFVFIPQTICVIMFEMLGAIMICLGVFMVAANTIKNVLYK